MTRMTPGSRGILLVALLALSPSITFACEITDVSGSARIASDEVVRATAVGLQIERGERIETGEDARVTLLCNGGLTVSVAPSSRLQVDRFLTETPTGWRRLFRRSGGQMQLFEGAAGFLMHGTGGSRFRLRTPNAVAAVRSTEWAVETNGKQSAVFVREGRVRAIGGGSSQALDPGEGIDIAGGSVSGVREWPASRVAALNERIGGAWP